MNSYRLSYFLLFLCITSINSGCVYEGMTNTLHHETRHEENDIVELGTANSVEFDTIEQKITVRYTDSKNVKKCLHENLHKYEPEKEESFRSKRILRKSNKTVIDKMNFMKSCQIEDIEFRRYTNTDIFLEVADLKINLKIDEICTNELHRKYIHMKPSRDINNFSFSSNCDSSDTFTGISHPEIPIKLVHSRYHYEYDYSLAKRIILSPFALVADILTMPLLIAIFD